MAQVITSVDHLTFSAHNLPALPAPKQVLMVEPTFFSVDYAINPHMADNIGNVDKTAARNQWQQVLGVFRQLGFSVHRLEGQKGLPDMVFCANQSLPYINPAGRKQVVMSIMHSDMRKEEVPYIEQWYRQQGYEIRYLDREKVRAFEGCGDAIWHSGRRLLWGGYGYRTSREAYKTVSGMLDVPVMALRLADEHFYHLDTCFCVLNETTVLIYPQAFTESGLKLIHAVFDHVIEASEDEAKERFACNASCPDGKNVIIQQGCREVNSKLREAGFTIHEVETSEYLKSGGSVFCMKQLLW
ncbi:dimethylarginine dimethylaminohydrolase family protein [Halalkalibaculum sp. DA384]|uniref:dimethylarginine dimethylaminohydrolase family protein n=1 Tax=Halalkalibaculum sp. DA384 TaxID=3373606 RepID=UPI0037551AE9